MIIQLCVYVCVCVSMCTCLLSRLHVVETIFLIIAVVSVYAGVSSSHSPYQKADLPTFTHCVQDLYFNSEVTLLRVITQNT